MHVGLYLSRRVRSSGFRKLNVASRECLVVLKCKAWIENRSLYAAGKLPEDREGDVHKHALDVCSLLSILDEDEVQLPNKLYDDVCAAAELYDAADEQAVLAKYTDTGKLPIPPEEAGDILRAMFKAAE